MEWQPTHINRTHDRAFNLTNTYRTDSDVTRHFGSISHTLSLTRISFKVYSEKIQATDSRNKNLNQNG